MEKADDIKILAGEYMDEAEIIYTPQKRVTMLQYGTYLQ
ncbi:hypothetical protein DFR97_001400 [Clostridium beijerinckii]|nr:hypothetical protein [Clostridium beijerinckii]